MALPSWANDTIAIIVPALVADHGSLVVDPTSPGTPTSVPGCSVQPEAGEEVRGERDQVRQEWRVFAPPGTAVTAGSLVSWDGRQYQVDGAPMIHRSPAGGVDHVEFVMWRWADVYGPADQAQ